MKFNVNEQEKSKIYALLETKEMNIIVADMLQAFFSYVDAVKGVTTTDDYISSMCDFWEIDMNNQENIDILFDRVIKELKELNDKDLKNNPYFKNINIKPVKIGNYYLGYDTYYPYQGFAYDDLSYLEYYLEISKVGYYSKEVKYPVLKHNKDVWMSITPNEIATMQNSIDEANGKVLVVGLGLGYYPYMISLKNDVKEIIIVEKDKDVIEIFKKNILPQFSHKEKITIVNDDAYKFIENNKTKFDYAFIDIWHNPNDGLPLYIKFKQIEHNLGSIKVSYWIESSILELYRRCYLTVVEEQLEGMGESNYQKAKNDMDKLINSIYHKTKNVTINSYASLLELLSDKNIILNI